MHKKHKGRIMLLLRIIFWLAFLWGAVRIFEWKNLYHPSKQLDYTPVDVGLVFEDVSFVTEDGKALHGWWIPHEKARGTIIYCHGNAGNIGGRVWAAKDLHGLGVNVFLFDYRGYGQSQGIPTEKGTYRDARAAYEAVKTQTNQEDPPIIVYGRSLGGAVAVQLGLDKPVRGLILESAFSSTVDVGTYLFPSLPVKWIVRYRYDALSKMPSIHVPVVMAHSSEDQTIPYELGQKNFAAANEPKEFFTLRGGHNEGGWSSSHDYWEGIERFVDDVFGPLQPHEAP